MTPENLIVTQQNDASLLKLCNEAIPQKEIDKPPALNYKDDILTRFNRPTDLSVEDTSRNTNLCYLFLLGRRS